MLPCDTGSVRATRRPEGSYRWTRCGAAADQTVSGQATRDVGEVAENSVTVEFRSVTLQVPLAWQALCY
ncbi:MAG: hypothetical protein ACHP9Z_12095 [Streptosporangiales bacterium]